MAGRLHDAFLAGFAPRMAGLYFNGLELLGEADRWSDVALGRRIGAEREKVIARRDEALARLDEAERLLAGLGVEAIDRPEDSSGYEPWADAVFDAASAAVASDPAAAVSHLLGYVMGEAIATLDVSASLSRLRELAPDNLWMRVQADSLERERATAERRLARLAVHPSLPEAVRTAAALAGHAVAGAARSASESGSESGSEGGRAAPAEAAARSLAEQVATIESALAGE